MLDLVVVGGTVVTGHTPVRADIGVKDGRIAVLSAPGSMTGDARETLEASGRFVVPGGIDAHVHFDLNVTEAMRAQSAVDGSRAAAFGGTTTFIDFALQAGDQSAMEAVEAKVQELRGQRPQVDYALHLMLTGAVGFEVMDELVAGASLPPVAAVAGWRWAMAAPVALCALLAAASAMASGRGAATATADRGGQEPDVALRLFPGHAFGFLMAGVQVTIFTFLTVYLTDDRSLSVGRAGSMLALLMVGGLVGRPVWGWISDRRHHDRVRVLQAVSLLSGAGLALVPVLGVPMLAAATLVVGFCAVGWNGVYIATVSESVPPARIGSTTGVALLLVNLGAVVLPPAVGALVEVSGWPAGWYLCAALSLLALAILQVSRAAATGAGG